jgi:hypothetical protein
MSFRLVLGIEDVGEAGDLGEEEAISIHTSYKAKTCCSTVARPTLGTKSDVSISIKTTNENYANY